MRLHISWLLCGGGGKPGSHILNPQSSILHRWNFYQPHRRLQRSECTSPSRAKRKPLDIEEEEEVVEVCSPPHHHHPSSHQPFMVRFTVKVLICIDMFLKSCAKLKLDTGVRPRGFKDPAGQKKKKKGQRDGTDLKSRLLYASLQTQKWDLQCAFFPLAAHHSRCRMFVGSSWNWETSGSGKGREAGSVSWLALAVEKTRIYICMAANISGSSVKPRPVQAGRVWPLTAAERSSRSSQRKTAQ